MPSNKGLGGKSSKRGKSGNPDTNRELIFKDNGQEYGTVVKVLGGRRLEIQCMDGEKRQCIIRGAMRNRVYVNVNDLVLVSIREFQNGTGDILHKYMPDEVRSLISYKEIPDTTHIQEDDTTVFAHDDEGTHLDVDAI